MVMRLLYHNHILMQAQTKSCQNCKQDFTIEPEDFLFYEKIKVPPPTFCPECRRQRRLAFRNTHSLYKRKDSFSGKEMLSIYSPDKDLVVIDQKDWWGDSWDPFDYGMEYDFSKTFFAQWKELRDRTPLQSLSNSKAVNSDYCNVAEENYDCYLVTACFRNERTMYSDSVSFIKDSMDLHIAHRTEFSYDDVTCTDSYKLFYSEDSHFCTDSYFLYDCRSCINCFMCTNLRSKSYCFLNEQMSKEAYMQRIAEYDLGDFETVQKLKEQFQELKVKSIHRFAQILNSSNVTGDNLGHAKNSKECFYVTEGPEDSKFMFWGAISLKECYDSDASGGGLELGYESFDVGVGSSKLFFSNVVYSSKNVEYSINCYNCSDIFGCIGLRNKQYCILNKQYTKEEYFELRSKIVEQMDSLPYVDKKGIAYRYGEFFPAEISPFAYNETVSNDYFPLEKQDVMDRGLAWKDKEQSTHKITLSNENIPANIKDVTDAILSEVIECAHKGECKDRCTTAFKILPNELNFYRRFGIPLPRLCYWCRHYERFRKRRPLKLWHRQCACDSADDSTESPMWLGRAMSTEARTSRHGHEGTCPNEFETSYAPERTEVIYCESCYQKEVL